MSREETKTAMTRLARNKALGVDGLPDYTLHEIAKLTLEEDGLDGLALI